MNQENEIDMKIFGFIWTSAVESLHCLSGPRFAKAKCWPTNLMHLLALEDKGIYALLLCKEKQMKWAFK